MVSLPVSRQTKPSTNSRSCSSDSPVLRSARISTIIGTMTFIHPDRINDNVPSKSNSTTRAWRAEMPGLTLSIISFMLLLELLHNRGEVVDCRGHNDAECSTQDTGVPKEFALGQDCQGRQDDRKLEEHFTKVESERLPTPQVALPFQTLRFLGDVFVVLLVFLRVLLVLRALTVQVHSRE